MYTVLPAVKEYQWAEIDYKKNICHKFVNNYTPVAELWYGTHPDGPAYIQETSEFIEDLIRPYQPSSFFKLLGVGKPLSIQIHPDETNAKRLHIQNPDVYRDPFAKPEMAIVLSENAFAFCGIRPIRDIARDILSSYSDLFDTDMIHRWNLEDDPLLIRDSFISVYEMSITKYEILTHRLTVKHQTFRWLNKLYPSDRGCAIAVLFLNFLTLRKFDAIRIPPNEIHCYLLGNFFECMSISDNVIRAGLTNKFIDYTSFFSLANFRECDLADIVLAPIPVDGVRTYEFNPLPLIRITDDINSLKIPTKCGDANFLFLIKLSDGECIVNNRHRLTDNKVVLMDLEQTDEKDFIELHGVQLSCILIAL